MAYGKAGVDWARAKRAYKQVRKQLGGDKLGKDYKPVMETKWANFLEYGNLDDRPRPGAPTIISDEDALKASEALKAGRAYTRKRGQHTLTLITYFTTVRQATLESAVIKEVMDKYDTTPHKLYNAMVRADPYLARRSFALKLRLSEEQMSARKSFAAAQLEEWGPELPLVRAELARIVQCDEGRWTYSVYTHGHQKAYVDKRTTLLHDYVMLSEICGEKEATVHFFICVSAHPKFAATNGLVYYEFTTGTTNIHRLFNTKDQTSDEAVVYQRKDGADASSTVTLEVADNLYLMVKHFQEITGEDPIIMMDNVKIQANIPDTKIESRYGTLNLPEGCRLRFPPHSSDINQVVEHSIGALKGGATEQLFEECGREVKFSEHSLQRIFKHQFKLFEQGHLYPKGVEHNMAKLPTVLRVIASEEDEWFLDENGKQHHGSNGNWPNAPDR